MEKSNKRGKIPQSDWPLILARYEAGETLASIARTYDCSPPAISYVVSRGRTQRPAVATPPAATGSGATQLIKANAVEPAAAGNGKAPTADGSTENSEPRPITPLAAAAVAGARERHDQPWPRQPNGLARNGNETGELPQWQRRPEPSQPNGDQRRTLHLSLGNASPDGAHVAEPGEPNAAAGNGPASDGADRTGQTTDFGQQTGFVAPQTAAFDSAVRAPEPDAAARKNGGSFIDKDLRARVADDIATFLGAFDAALAHDTQESRSALREATDRLLRAGARTRIELERLEARMPLPSSGNDQQQPMWRTR